MNPPVTPSVQVVVALFNGAECILDQIRALANQEYDPPPRIVVADNGSSDNGIRMIEELQLASVSVIDATLRRGQAHARNVGAIGNSDLILFCDQDDVVAPGWIAALSKGLQEYEIVGGSFDTLTLNHGVTKWRPSPARADFGRPLPFTSGSNLGVRRCIFKALGGFREDYYGGGEDADLCWRAQIQGFHLGYIPDAVLRYRYRRLLLSHFKQQVLYGRSASRLTVNFPDLDHPLPISFWREMGWLIRNGPLLLSRDTAGAWVRSLGYWIGTRDRQPSDQ